MIRWWQKVMYGSAITTILIGCAFLVWFISCLLWPYQGLTHVPQPLVVDTRVVPVGTMLSYGSPYCTDGSLPASLEISRELESMASSVLTYVAPAIGVTLHDRCGLRKVSIGIPAYITPGIYRVRIHTALRVNQWRTIEQDWVSESFEVVAK